MKNYLYYLTFWIVATTFLSSCQPKEIQNMETRELNSNWTYRQVNGSVSGTATVPGTIHTDLLVNKQIEDPFYRINEKSQQWIDKEDWEYTTVFQLSEKEIEKQNLILDFKGLDTYADVYVNDSLFLQADNMFREWEIDIKNVAKVGENQVRIYFHSPIAKGLELLKASPYVYPANNDQSENGGLGDQKVSVFTRKAGYHYGWDWGPRFVTSGVWRPINLKIWDALRIKDVFIQQTSVKKEEAQLLADFSLEANEAFSGEVLLTDKSTGKVMLSKQVDVEKGSTLISIPFTITNPKLWWSNGLGAPNLYQFEAKVIKDNEIVTNYEFSTGLRSLKLIREKDEAGESFYFELNGVAVFAKGANYIPNDNFLPRVSQADYEKVIADAKDANMNMLRVWGGGIYENDIFYDLCDKNGILVWQDFMFACSMYPGNEKMLNSIKEEAKDNVIRLRNHPSIALWCGNNEMNTAWSYFSKDGWGWKELYTEEQREEIQKAYMDIFHGILPDAVSKYTDGDAYWPSSPQAGFAVEKHAGYETSSGDMHYWGVWHGLHPFEDFDKYKARFMSEYGFQSFPDFETVKKYTLPEDYNIESEVMASHQRSGIGNLRIKEYMSWDYKVPADFEQFLYMSHVLQARGIKAAIEAHRRAMPYCMGTLYWQINDCWPVASWSSTDYYHKWKAMHYMVRKAYQSVLLSAFANEGQLKIYGVSDLLESKNAKLSLRLVNFEGKLLFEKEIAVDLVANASRVLYDSSIETLLGDYDKNAVVLQMELKTDGKLIADNKYYFAKPKELLLPKANVEVQIVENEGKYIVEVSTDKLVRDLYLNFKDSDLKCSDNYFDLLPGEKRTLELSGSDIPKPSALQLMHLQQITE
ncbi:beta-mannosidase [Labilibaculum filiforme]|uniref:Beta-mannosidase B n=2 Tax=Labilibaculum filiforme TaxID=1940526 RepID=A0A2N3I3Y5_9BACT|nr:beta-mannosidase [Labilibaculum filiforme]